MLRNRPLDKLVRLNSSWALSVSIDTSSDHGLTKAEALLRSIFPTSKLHPRPVLRCRPRGHGHPPPQHQRRAQHPPALPQAAATPRSTGAASTTSSRGGESRLRSHHETSTGKHMYISILTYNQSNRSNLDSVLHVTAHHSQVPTLPILTSLISFNIIDSPIYQPHDQNPPKFRAKRPCISNTLPRKARKNRQITSPHAPQPPPSTPSRAPSPPPSAVQTASSSPDSTQTAPPAPQTPAPRPPRAPGSRRW